MVTDQQLRSISLKSKIISEILTNEVINVEEVKEMLTIENVLVENQQVDEFFKMVLDIIRGNKSRSIRYDFKDLFKQLCPSDNDYSDFVVDFLNFLVNDSGDIEIKVRIEQLKSLDYSVVPGGSEIRKLYLYNMLSLSLVNNPIDLAFIDKLNTELMCFNNGESIPDNREND